MKKSFLLRFAIDAFGRVAMLLLTVFIARLLGVEGFGKIAFAISVVNLAYYFTECGTHLVFLREMGRVTGGSSKEEAAVVWEDFFGLKIMLTLAVGVAVTLASYWIWPWENPFILVAMAGWMMGNSLVDFLHQACNAFHRVEVSGVVMALHRGLCLVLGGAAVLIYSSLPSVAWGLCVGSLVGASLSLWTVHRGLGLNIRFLGRPARWWGCLKTSFPLALANIFGSAYLRLGVIMLPWLKFYEQVGFYGAAQKLFEAGYLVPTAFVTIAMPHFSRALTEHPSALRRLAGRAGKFVAGLSLLWFIGGEVFASGIIRLVFGGEYAPAVPLLRVLVLANALVFVNYFLTTFLVVFNRLHRHALNELAALSACAAMSYFFIRRFGAAGAAWSVVGAEIILFFLTAAALWSARSSWRGTKEGEYENRG